VPWVVRIVGTNAEEAQRLLREASFETATSLDEAARKAVAAADGAGVGGAGVGGPGVGGPGVGGPGPAGSSGAAGTVA
jgi:hypothetical protein